MADYYKVLGVDKGATDDQLKQAYRKAAKQYHPDKFSNSKDSEKKDAESKFKEVNQAYSVLSDKQKRSNYDQFGTEDPMQGGGGWSNAGAGAGFDFGDIFSDIFSGFGGGGRRTANPNRPMDGEDIILTLNLTFKEAVFGVEKDVNIRRSEECTFCKGTGAKNSSAYKTCGTCKGTGQRTVIRRTPFGQMSSTETCQECKGNGRIITERCAECRGSGSMNKSRSIKVKIPAGVNTDNQLAYYGEGQSGRNGGVRGNVIIVLQVAPHKLFVRKGYDLYVDIPISITQAATGCKIDIPTLKSPVKYTIPEGTQSNTVFRIKGEGVKYLKKEAHGDLYLRIVVEVPKSLSSKQKRMIAELEDSFAEKQLPTKKKYNELLREYI